MVVDKGFFVGVLGYGEVDYGACGDCFGEEDGGEFDLVVVLGEEDGHAGIELANGELHLAGGLRHLQGHNVKRRRRGRNEKSKMKMSGQDRNARSEMEKVPEPEITGLNEHEIP